MTSKPSDYINCLSWLKDGLIICLTVCQTGRLSVCFIVCQTVCWTVFLTVCLNLYTTVCLNVYLTFCLTFWRTVCLTVCLTLFYTVSQTASKTICLTICLTSGHGVIYFQAACGDQTAKAKWATNFLVGCSSCIDKFVFFSLSISKRDLHGWRKEQKDLSDRKSNSSNNYVVIRKIMSIYWSFLLKLFAIISSIHD